MKTKRFEVTSPGEALWLTLRSWHAEQGAVGGTTGMTWADPAGRLGGFVFSTVVSATCAQLVDRARGVIKAALGETILTDLSEFRDLTVTQVKRFCVEILGMSYLDRRVELFADYSFECAIIARRSISDFSRGTALRQAARLAGSVACYCCGEILGKADVLRRLPLADVSLDHLWPKAYGGVSTEDNLLPVCTTCNGLKMDRISWDVYGIVQDYSAANHGPDGRALTQLALHRRAALQLAEARAVTIKEAFVALGPWGRVELIHPDAGEWFFNRTAHDTRVLPEIW